jgi:hypothetical protein
MEASIDGWSYLAHFFLELEMYQTKFRENQNTHKMFSIFPPLRKLSHLWEHVEECFGAGQATDDK